MNWKTGKVLYTGENVTIYAWQPDEWLICDAEENETYFDVLTGRTSDQPVMTAVQRKLAAADEGYRVLYTYDGYYVSCRYDEETDVSDHRIYSGRGKLIASADDVSYALFYGLIEGTHGNPCLFDGDSTATIGGYGPSDLTVLGTQGHCGVLSKDNGLILPLEYDDVRVFTGCGAAAWKNGECHLYDTKGRLLW